MFSRFCPRSTWKMDFTVLKRFQQRTGNSNKPVTNSINHYYTYQHLPVEAINSCTSRLYGLDQLLLGVQNSFIHPDNIIISWLMGLMRCTVCTTQTSVGGGKRFHLLARCGWCHWCSLMSLIFYQQLSLILQTLQSSPLPFTIFDMTFTPGAHRGIHSLHPSAQARPSAASGCF